LGCGQGVYRLGFVGSLRGFQFFGAWLALQHLRILCGLLRVRHFSKNRHGPENKR
jgi:hypothetical protein